MHAAAARSPAPPAPFRDTADVGHAGRWRCVFFLAVEHDTRCSCSQLILDFDTAIQVLMERLGRDDPETVKLTGIYCNLIRCWAEV